jgi:hypothetical protein
MRRLASAFILLLGACGSGNPSQVAPRNVVHSGPSAPPAAKAAPAADAVQAAPDGDPGLAGLSPAQRRAYELGYRDCSHGRYAPDNHLEAYRTGCGAAHDRAERPPPQG